MKGGSAVLAGLMAMASLALAAGKDGLWEVNTRMEIPGMPEMPKGMVMPGMPGGGKMTVCLAEGAKYESKAQEKDCKVLETRQNGNKTTAKVKCKDATMTIEHEVMGKDRWRNKAVTESRDGTMTVESEGRRIGTCDAAKEGGMPREAAAMLETQQGEMAARGKEAAEEAARECREAVAKWPRGGGAFAQYDALDKARRDAIGRDRRNADAIGKLYPENPQCAKAKTEFCAKAKAEGARLGNRKGYMAAFAERRHDLEEAMQYCQVDFKAPLGGHCKSAEQEQDFAFVAEFCPAERKLLELKHCAGRSYSSVEPKYLPLCGGDAPAAGGKDPREQQIEQGVKQLKKLFGF